MEFDTKDTWSPVCPHCGYENIDGWEDEFIYGEIVKTECPKCGEVYELEIMVAITYTSSKMEVNDD